MNSNQKLYLMSIYRGLDTYQGLKYAIEHPEVIKDSNEEWQDLLSDITAINNGTYDLDLIARYDKANEVFCSCVALCYYKDQEVCLKLPKDLQNYLWGVVDFGFGKYNIWPEWDKINKAQEMLNKVIELSDIDMDAVNKEYYNEN